MVLKTEGWRERERERGEVVLMVESRELVLVDLGCEKKKEDGEIYIMKMVGIRESIALIDKDDEEDCIFVIHWQLYVCFFFLIIVFVNYVINNDAIML